MTLLSRTLLPLLVIGAFLGLAQLAHTEEAAPTFRLEPLPYAYDALAPVIDEETMRLHHGFHHRAYVNNLNAKVAEFPRLAEIDLITLMAEISDYDAGVRNNGGGHYNHELFWSLMAAPGTGGEPSAELLGHLERDLEGREAFTARFQREAGGIFGSGWAWLILKDDGKLAIVTTANQDNPLMDVMTERGQPLLALDVWEHAYYVGYRNRRAEYIAAWWQVVDWNEVNRRYAAAMAPADD